MHTPHDAPRSLFLRGMLAALLAFALLVPAGAAAQTDVESLYRFGLQQLEDGDVENAINTFRKVLELDSQHALSHSSLGYIYLQTDKVDLARPSFERAVQLDPGLAAAHNGIGLVHARLGADNQALSSFREALSRDPGYLDARYNMGITLTQMEQWSQAREAFQQVLRADSSFRDVHYRLGLIALRNREYETAEQELVAQYRQEPNHRENRLEMGRLYYETEDFRRAEEILLPMVTEMFPDWVPPKMLLADIYMAVNDYERANQLYLMSYREFDDDATAVRMWRDVVDIAYPDERRTYEATPLEDKAEFFRRFWKRRDIDPTSEANEVLVEHYRRLRFARQYFSSRISAGGYDDRGKIYLKHGEPDQVVEFPAGDSETRPNVTWEYHSNRKERLIVHFVDRGNGIFNVVPSLMEASMTIPLGVIPTTDELNPGEVPNESELWIDRIPIQTYRERAIIDPIFDRIANMMEELQRVASGPGGPSEARTYQERLEGLLSQERMDVLRDLGTLESTNTYATVLPADPLSFNFYTAAFRDIQNQTKLEVYYGLPTSDLTFERYGEGQKLTVDLGVGVFDEEWNEIARINETREFISTDLVSQQLGSAVVDLNRIVVKPGVYNFAISVTDRLSGRMGVYRDSLRVSDFSTRDLAISDIEVAGRIEESRRGGRFYRDGLEIIPMPSRTFTTDQKIWIYYEIYNLAKDDFGTTEFVTTYTIQPASESMQRGILSSTFRSLGRLVGLGKREAVTVEGEPEIGIRAEEHKYLELAFPNPSPGIYELVLTVRDANSGKTTARVQQFMMTPPAGR